MAAAAADRQLINDHGWGALNAGGGANYYYYLIIIIMNNHGWSVLHQLIDNHGPPSVNIFLVAVAVAAVAMMVM